MKLALLSDVTLELLAEVFRPEDEVWIPSGFGAWRQVCLEPPPDLRAFAPDLICLVLDDSSSQPVEPARRAGRSLDSLRAKLPGVPVVCVDLGDLAREVGPKFFDARLRALASCPWSLLGQRAIRDEVRRLARIRTLPPRKVLAIDFDGVLWHGVLTEDGAHALAPATELQQELLSLKQRGILLVGLTKNDAEEVASVWRVPGMVLQADDFVAVRADWRPKAENLTEVAHELNLSTDAFVFADDNPGECAAMAAAHPEVAVELVASPDAATVRHWARMHFPDFGATDEDRMRTDSYRADAARHRAAEGLTLEGYLASLGTVVDFHPARTDEIPRLAQLSNRCNQFNARQCRYSEADLRQRLSDPTYLVYSVAVRDRFGDLGLVALVVVRREGASARLEEWVMSCRAMNRRIEDETWACLAAALRPHGIFRVDADVRPTEKNAPVRNFFSSDFRHSRFVLGDYGSKRLKDGPSPK